MKNLCIMGTAESGKTALAVGLAQKFKQEGLKVAYFKPIGNNSGKGDSDARLMQQMLQMEQPLEVISPVPAGPFYLSHLPQPNEVLHKIKQAYEAVAGDADLVLIDGPVYPYVLSSLGLSAFTLATEFNAAILYMINVKNDFSLDEAICFNDFIASKDTPLTGNVFNNVPRPFLDKTEDIYKPALAQRGYQTVGIIPHCLELSAPSVALIQETLDGEILSGDDKLDRLVEDMVVGAMTMESALSYMRRANNKAFITGGDRGDMALAALETDTSVLILTGGLYPAMKVVARAQEKGVPVLLVREDTFTVVKRLAGLSGQINAENRQSIELARNNVEKYCDWQTILNSL